MTFEGAAADYDRFMGRYSAGLAAPLADFADLQPTDRVLDVGCGTGVLTAHLVRRVGAARVAAIDPSTTYAAAAAERCPGVDVRVASADALPFPDASFDAVLAQLVVHFLPDPVSGLVEMRRVTRPGGVVAACVWDFGEGGSPLSAFWDAARELDPTAPGEDTRPGTRRGHLRELFAAAGFDHVAETALTVRVAHPTFEEWWAPFRLGVGPAGDYLAELPEERRGALERLLRERMPAPFVIEGVAWTARGMAPTRAAG